MDIFYEQYVTKNAKSLEKTFQISKITIAMLAIICWILLLVPAALVFSLVWCFIFIISRNVFVDYEYEVTSNELTISKVIMKKSRKTLATLKIDRLISVKECHEVNKDDRIINATHKDRDAKIYFFNTSIGVVGFKMSCDDEMSKILNGKKEV